MHFTARSLALTRSAVGRNALHRERFTRGRPVSVRSVNSGSVTLSVTQSTVAASLHTWSKIPILVGGLLFATGVWGLSRTRSKSISEAQSTQDALPRLQDAFALDKDLVRVGSPREVLSKSPVTKNLIRQDNLFDKMMEVEMVKEIHCFYDPKAKEFHSIVHLGSEVCGYPNTVHGGLTAAIMDETFGGLMFNVWRSGQLGLSLPAVTARLEVDYCNRLPQNAVVLCTTKLESEKRSGRSFWMQAELSDQSKNITYATARACFVSPSWNRTAVKWIKGIMGTE